MKARIAVLPGDGIGPEVMPQALQALEAIAKQFGHSFEFRHADVGGCAIDKTGRPLPDETLTLAKESDAIMLGAVGALMLVESLGTIRKSKAGKPASARKPGQHNWIHGLPFKTRFHRSKLYISVIPPLLIGVFIGFLSGIMGVGGGFILVPAMIYLLKMPTNVVVGTSLYQIVFVTAATTIMQASWNHTVDIVLGALLMVGGVIGAQIGTVIGAKLKGEELRFLMAALVLLVALRMAYTLIADPGEFYTISSPVGGH